MIKVIKCGEYNLIKSMTAYGRAAGDFSGGRVTFEIKSVNNRHLDCNVKTPRRYFCFEEKIKAEVQAFGVHRGKLDIFMDVRSGEKEVSFVTLNTGYAEAYIAALEKLRDDYNLRDDISVMTVAQRSDLFNVDVPDEDTDAVWLQVEPVLKEALSAFVAAREAEGQRLAADISEKIKVLRSLREKLLERSEKIVPEYRARLEERLRAVLSEHGVHPDEGRILTECAIFADKTAIDEELVRLSSHFESFEQLLGGKKGDVVGRDMDFLLQEMNREVNTSGSKISDTDGSMIVIEMKGMLEKIREQIQNLE